MANTTANGRRRWLVSACAATGMTEQVVRRLGAAPFLPALFPLRYANMGGLDPAQFSNELHRCRSFEDDRWCGYWDAIADGHVDDAIAALNRIDPQAGEEIRAALAAPGDRDPHRLRAVLAPWATLLADHALLPPEGVVRAMGEGEGPGHAAPLRAVAPAVASLLRAVTYLQVSAFPGGTPRRLAAYHRSRALFDLLAAAIAPGLETIVEPVSIETGGDTVRGYHCLPATPTPCPLVIVTNGLEGTVQELLVPLLRYHATGLGVLVMEMPGSYDYAEPMSAASEAIYRQVIDSAVADPRVDADRIGFVGVSFGGYWAARMAAADPRLACAVACGAPTDRSFAPKLGLPEIILEALAEVTGATSPISLLRRLRALSLRGRYDQIRQPLLVINGDDDTLLSTRDSIALAEGAPRGELLLYPDDDHCAMGHYREWMDASQDWLAAQLLDGSRPAGAGASASG
ncbi:MAG: alpha/beta hydrolase [Patulibacter minatonensis]